VVLSRLKIAVQMDPLEVIKFASDSTWQILLEGRKYGDIYYYTPQDLFCVCGEVFARVQKLVINDKGGYFLEDKFNLKLDECDILFVRQDPPYDMRYITSTYLLERLPKKVLLINNPSALRNFPEKLSVLNFKQFTPDTLITENFDIAQDFAKKYDKIVLKPLYGFAGRDVFSFKHDDIKFKYFFEDLLQVHQSPLVVQEFIANVFKGDKRIILIDGEAEACFLRVPGSNAIRANLAQGGEAVYSELNERDVEICSALKQFLKDNGLFFAGIDVIDGYLTEINVTSPTGLVQVMQLSNAGIVKKFWDKVIYKLNSQI
jgi:glutathione synthase